MAEIREANPDVEMAARLAEKFLDLAEAKAAALSPNMDVRDAEADHLAELAKVTFRLAHRLTMLDDPSRA